MQSITHPEINMQRISTPKNELCPSGTDMVTWLTECDDIALSLHRAITFGNIEGFKLLLEKNKKEKSIDITHTCWYVRAALFGPFEIKYRPVYETFQDHEYDQSLAYIYYSTYAEGLLPPDHPSSYSSCLADLNARPVYSKHHPQNTNDSYNKANLLMVILTKVQAVYAVGENKSFLTVWDTFVEELIKCNSLCVLGRDSQGRDITDYLQALENLICPLNNNFNKFNAVSTLIMDTRKKIKEEKMFTFFQARLDGKSPASVLPNDIHSLLIKTINSPRFM